LVSEFFNQGLVRAQARNSAVISSAARVHRTIITHRRTCHFMHTPIVVGYVCLVFDLIHEFDTLTRSPWVDICVGVFRVGLRSCRSDPCPRTANLSLCLTLTLSHSLTNASSLTPLLPRPLLQNNGWDSAAVAWFTGAVSCGPLAVRAPGNPIGIALHMCDHAVDSFAQVGPLPEVVAALLEPFWAILLTDNRKVLAQRVRQSLHCRCDRVSLSASHKLPPLPLHTFTPGPSLPSRWLRKVDKCACELPF
jgi:hypothetical protein